MMSKSNSSDVETLYYMLDFSVLKFDLEEAQLYLQMLRHEYELDETSFDVLQDGRFEHLQELSQQVENGWTVKSFDVSSLKDIPSIKEDKFQVDKEKELFGHLWRNREILKNELRAGRDFRIVSEQQKVLFGTVDVVAQDQETLFVIELKRDAVKHDIVGQVEKYMFDFRKNLIYKFWKKVAAVVIANAFEDFALQELFKHNVICLKYECDDKHFSLARVE